MLTRRDYWLLLYMVSSVCFSEPLVKLSATGLFFAAFPEESGPLVVTVTVLIFTRSVFFTSNYTEREQHLTHSHSQATITSFKRRYSL